MRSGPRSRPEIVKLLQPFVVAAWHGRGEPAMLPDLAATPTEVPAGVRLFLRAQGRRLPVVEVVLMPAAEWDALSYPAQPTIIAADTLRRWFVQLYPPAIRTVDQQKPFQQVTGSLSFEPAGADKNGRYALLRGKIHLAKGDERESAFEGTFEAVLMYPLRGEQVRSVRGVAEGDYVYRIRGSQRLPLRVAIESRPK